MVNPSARGPFCLLNRPSGPGSAVRPTPGIRAARCATLQFQQNDVEMLMRIYENWLLEDLEVFSEGYEYKSTWSPGFFPCCDIFVRQKKPPGSSARRSPCRPGCGPLAGTSFTQPASRVAAIVTATAEMPWVLWWVMITGYVVKKTYNMIHNHIDKPSIAIDIIITKVMYGYDNIQVIDDL